MNGGDWELYNIKADPSELNNLSTVMPDKLEELANQYRQQAANLHSNSFAPERSAD